MALLAGLGLSTGCSSSGDDPPPPPPPNIAASLEGLGLTELLAALTEAGLLDDLATGTRTLFAPTNDAFAALPDGYLDGLTSEEQTDLLLYHLIPDAAVSSLTAMGLDSAMMANGDSTLLDVVGGALFVNDARVVQADFVASNGLIHVINRVLVPPVSMGETLERLGEFTVLTGAVDAIGGLEGEGPFTVLAPTDAAFAALPPDFLPNLTLEELGEILHYHAVEGEVVASEAALAELVMTAQGSNLLFSTAPAALFVNGFQVARFNIPTTDGILYVLDNVLLLPDTIAGAADTLGSFQTFLTAVEAAGLDAILADPEAGPFTVFAPTDAAFAALPEGTLDALLEPENIATLQQILNYHVVAGALTANGVAAAAGVGLVTLQGDTLDVAVVGTGVTVDGANMIVTNVLASNGILHGIDAVLIPDGVVLP